MNDRIVDEAHRIRREHAKAFGGDLHAMCEDLRKRQAESGRKVVTRPAKRLTTVGK